LGRLDKSATLGLFYAASFGFEDRSQFSREFKKFRGCAPTAIRARRSRKTQAAGQHCPVKKPCEDARTLLPGLYASQDVLKYSAFLRKCQARLAFWRGPPGTTNDRASILSFWM
jgi:hypothetical protein